MTTEIKFNNQYVLSRMEENKLIKNSLIIQELKYLPTGKNKKPVW
jgi:hypothetical protein